MDVWTFGELYFTSTRKGRWSLVGLQCLLLNFFFLFNFPRLEHWLTLTNWVGLMWRWVTVTIFMDIAASSYANIFYVKSPWLPEFFYFDVCRLSLKSDTAKSIQRSLNSIKQDFQLRQTVKICGEIGGELEEKNTTFNHQNRVRVLCGTTYSFSFSVGLFFELRLFIMSFHFLFRFTKTTWLRQ